MKYPKISDDKEVQKRYVEARKAGSSHTLADMLAHQRPAGYHNHYSPMHPRARRGQGH